MIKQVFKTMVAFLAVATMTIGPVRGQNGNVSWVLTPHGNLQTGDTVVIVDKTSARALPKPASSSSAPGTISVTLNSAKDTLTSTPGATLKWVVVRDGNNYKFRKPGTDNEYLYFTGDDNGVRVGNNENNQFSFENGGTYNVPFLKNNATTRYFGLTNTNLWRSLSDNSTSTIKNTVIGFYKKTVIPTYTVRFAEGMSGWQVQDVTAATSATAPAVLQNVMAGDSLVVTAPATLPGKVKSVKAVKYVAPAATVTTDPTATATLIEAGSTTALVNAGAANGGTMMYAVTTTNAQPTSTDGFSDAIPTAQGRTAGTYYVWYYAKADADHSDSEIAGPVNVTVTPAPTTVTWNSSNISDLRVSGTFQSYTKEGITLSANADMNEAEWYDYGDESMNGIEFQVNQSGGFTFTAPTGKKFTKIEMTLTGPAGWNLASLGTGWAYGENFDPMTMDEAICKATWTGSAASTVGLLTGAGHFSGERVKSIVFTLIDAQ